MKYERALEIAEGLTNPAWDFIKEVPHDRIWDGFNGPHAFTPAQTDYRHRLERDDGHREVWRGEGRRAPGLPKFYRSYVTSRWTWAIPSPDAIARILTVLNGRPVVEIGAGNGYWAWLLSQAGVCVNAYDIAPVGHNETWFKHQHLEMERVGELSGFEGFEHQEFSPVMQGGPEAVHLQDKDRVLFLCWPTMGNFAAESVKAYRGDMVIYIGEGNMGCNADDEFFWLMEPEPGEEKPEITWANQRHWIVQWAGLHDALNIYTRET